MDLKKNLDSSISKFSAVNVNFQYLLASHNIENSSNEFRDFGNEEIAVEKLELSSIHAEL